MGEAFYLTEVPPSISPIDYSWFSESSTSEDPSHHNEESFHENILQHIDPVLNSRIQEDHKTFGVEVRVKLESLLSPSELSFPEISEPKEPLRSPQRAQETQNEEARSLKERLAAIEAQKAALEVERTGWLQEKREMEALLIQLEEENNGLKERRLEEELRHEIERLRLNLQSERSRRQEEAEKISHYEAQLEAFEKSASLTSKNLEELIQERVRLEESLRADCDRRVRSAEKRQELLFTQRLKSEREALTVVLKERLQEEKNDELRKTMATLSSKFEDDISQIRLDLAAQSKEEVEKMREFFLEENTRFVAGSFEQRQIIDQLEEALEAKEAKIKELRAKLRRTSLAALVFAHPEDQRELESVKSQLDQLQKHILGQEEEKRRLLRKFELKASEYSAEISSQALQLQALAQENRKFKERERQASEALLREHNKLYALEVKKLHASFEEERKKLAEDFERQKERDASFAQLRAREQIKGIMENVSLMKAEFAAHEQRLLEQHAQEKHQLTEQLLAAKKTEWKEELGAADLSWITSSFSTAKPFQSGKARSISNHPESPRSIRNGQSLLSSGNLTPVSLSSSPIISPTIYPEDFPRFLFFSVSLRSSIQPSLRTESILKHERGSKNGREGFRVTFS